MRNNGWLSIGALVISACVISGAQDRVLDHQMISIPKGGLERIIFRVQAGNLEVIGESQRTEVDVELEYVAQGYEEDSIDFLMEGLHFDHQIRGKELFLTTEMDRKSWNRSGKIHITAYVPRSMEIRIDDSSGWLKVQGINNNLEIKDSSGDILVSSVEGGLVIDDSSGDIEVDEVLGSVEIDDTSGDIDVRRSGNVRLSDSSGDIEVNGSSGDVVIDSDTSGDIHVRDVSGNFEVRSDSSGHIHYSDVRGQTVIPENKRK
jgi:DUF4097 and DUF4098 domain-containing protein YvlB